MDDPTPVADRYQAPALDKGLDILELLAEQPGGLNRAEIVKAMGRSPGEIYRMLERLVGRSYVVRSLEGDRYALSMKLFGLAHRHPPLRRLVAPAQPLMDAFARKARQSCHLVALDGDAAVVVAQASCPGNWEFGLRVGAPIDLVGTGSGQMLLACLDADKRQAHLSRLGRSRRAALGTELDVDLELYGRQGFRIGPSRQVQGIDDLSVPIGGADGQPLAVLTCPYVRRIDETHLSVDDTLGLLVSAVAKLSLG